MMECETARNGNFRNFRTQVVLGSPKSSCNDDWRMSIHFHLGYQSSEWLVGGRRVLQNLRTVAVRKATRSEKSEPEKQETMHVRILSMNKTC